MPTFKKNPGGMKPSGFKLRSGNGPLKFKNMGSSPARKDDKETVTVDGTTYENPYTAYQNINIPKKDLSGAPVAGGKVYSPVSGLQVSGPGAGSGRERTDEMMRGEGKVWMMEGDGLDTTDTSKSGLPDEFETGLSPKIKKLAKNKEKKKDKKESKAEKIKAYQKSQLTL